MQMTGLSLLGGAAIVLLVGLSFQIWGWSSETNKRAIRVAWRLLAAICGTMIVVIIYSIPASLVTAAFAGAAIAIVWTTLGSWAR
jgi:hypothetical protein